MSFSNQLPEWYAAGVEPQEEKKTAGFVLGDKLPANWINWQWALTFGALQELQQKALERTLADLTLYVSPTGSDTNTGLSAGVPLKTIEAAIDRIPPVVNHAVTINIAAGTYAEDVKLLGLQGAGGVHLIGDAANPANVTISYIELISCPLAIAVQGVRLNNSTGRLRCFLNFNSVCDMNKVIFVGNARTYNGIHIDRGSQIISESVFNDFQDAIEARWNSQVLVENCTGSGNVNSITSTHNAKVGVTGPIPGGTLQFNPAWGGTIDQGYLSATQANTTLYVSPTGNDWNDGLTSGTAMKTITAAVTRIPKYLRHAITILVAPGTYAEEITVQGFIGVGNIRILGAASLADAVNYVIQGINVNTCHCFVQVEGFTATRTTWHGFYANGNIDVYFHWCRCVAPTNGTTNFNGFKILRSFATIGDSEASNRGSAIDVTTTSALLSFSNIGSGNQNGLACSEGSTIGKSGTQPGGTLAESIASGGAIR